MQLIRMEELVYKRFDTLTKEPRLKSLVNKLLHSNQMPKPTEQIKAQTVE